ncbi:MAG: redoxin domain-containing protein, partial [Candidatus Omnitrophica bacterium]|nr:redoxin domain-containing protein [Candidatus Omnitrophota bacterium]
MLCVNHPAPPFTALAVENGKRRTVSLKDLKGKWTVLFFYPKDFTFVCPTEVIGFHKEVEAFRKEGAVILG